ncbi:MAG: 2-oxo acid dehydrogenase subunit E2 [Deltaproteobacteria bacterium]|nr:2-oxo acid dehydrogenase subunit E2 [Deltaproteobacteria bacterium]
MAAKIKMPKWGLTMKEGKITKWLKKEGDRVKKGEPLFEVETEKITNLVESTAEGIVFQIVVPSGATVPIETVVAVVAGEGEQPERLEGAAATAAGAAAPAAEAARGAQPEKPREAKFVRASPAARRLAKELGVDLASVAGSGPDGRVSEEDVKKFHEEGPPPPKITPLAEEMARQAGLDISTLTGTGEGGKITKEDVERALGAKAPEMEPSPVRSIPFSGMRRAIAQNMHASLHTTAQLTTFVEVDATETVRFRDKIREEYKNDPSVKVSLNDIIVMAASRVLKRFPIMNSTLVGEEILLHDAVHMGVAVALAEGLIVPVLRNADKKGLLRIAREVRELARKAREGGLTVDEVTGGTFTITNVSMFEVDGFTPILKPPETGILGVGRTKDKPAVYNGAIAIRTMMFLSLTFDHQVADGAPASDFLQTLARHLENPSLILA